MMLSALKHNWGVDKDSWACLLNWTQEDQPDQTKARKWQTYKNMFWRFIQHIYISLSRTNIGRTQCCSVKSFLPVFSTFAKPVRLMCMNLRKVETLAFSQIHLLISQSEHKKCNTGCWTHQERDQLKYYFRFFPNIKAGGDDEGLHIAAAPGFLV